MTGMVTSTSTTVTVDQINVITVTAGPIIAMTTGIDVIITTTTTVMIDAMTIVVTTAMTGMTTARVIAVTTNAATAEMIGVMIDVSRTTTATTTITARSGPHRHHLKGATLMVRFSQPTERSISSSAVAKRPKATNSFNRMQGRSGMSTLKLHNLCVGRSSQSLYPGKIIGSISLTPGPTRWSSIP
jgi:hypothetical protein